MANINKIRLSGQTYDIQDPNASKTVELTQAQYDALTVKDPNTFYIITDAEGADLSNYYTKSETSGATEISTALNAKADTATTYTKTEVDNAITAATSTKQDTLVSGTNIKTINNESLLGSGNITIQGGGSGSSYTAGDGIDITNDVISVTGKVDTTTFNTYSGSVDTALSGKQDTLSAGTGIEISGNVISATGGGGKAIEAGRGITVTTGETADTVSFNLPISGGGSSNLSVVGGRNTSASYNYSFVFGDSLNQNGGSCSVLFGDSCKSNGSYTFAGGWSSEVKREGGFAYGEYVFTKNKWEHSFGRYNNSVSASTIFGNSGNTLFSVGNGTADNARHNAFEIRQNGDIYLSYNGSDIKLQDLIADIYSKLPTS